MRRRNRVQRPIRISITSRWARGGEAGRLWAGQNKSIKYVPSMPVEGKSLVNPTMTCAFVSRGIKVHPTFHRRFRKFRGHVHPGLDFVLGC